MADLYSFLRKGFTLRNGVLIPPDRKGDRVADFRPIQVAKTEAGNQKRLILPYPVSVNRLYGFNRKTGRRFMYKEGKEFCDEVRRIAVRGDWEPLEGPVVFTMWLYRPRNSGDLTNAIKCLEDVLQGILYMDDKQIEEHHAYRFDDKDNPRVEVLVRPL